jgi:hypothetical protein
MKTTLLRVLVYLLVVFTMNSCSSDASEDSSLTAKSQLAVQFDILLQNLMR